MARNINEKVNVKIQYPVSHGALEIFDIELTKRIKVFQLMRVLKKSIDLSHMNDIHVMIEDKNIFHQENSKNMLFLKNGDNIHLLSENCRAAPYSIDFSDDDDSDPT